MRRMNSPGEELGELNLAIKRHLELQIKNLQNVLRGPEMLELLFKGKRRSNAHKRHTGVGDGDRNAQGDIVLVQGKVETTKRLDDRIYTFSRLHSFC